MDFSTTNGRNKNLNTVDPDGDTTLYQYDGKANLAYTVASMTKNATSIDWNNDRITCTTNDVTTNNNANVRRTRTYVWNQNGVDQSALISEIRVSTDGLTNWQTVYRDAGTPVTTTNQTSYSGNSRSTITTAPDGSYTISAYSYGRPISTTRYDSNGNPIGGATYGYDPQGRQNTVTDARNGTTTYGFNNADLVTSVTAPLSQTTTTTYNNMLQAVSVTQPDNMTVNSVYLPTGELGLQYGSRTYPVGYGYDYAGRLKTMTNWSNFSSGSGARVTTWNYDGYRGFLTNKTFPDSSKLGYVNTSANRLASRTWARGITTTYAYDNAGGLATIVYSGGATSNVTNTYDRLGRLIQVGGASSTESLTYNSANQLLSESYSGGTLNGLTVTNNYDAYLRRTNLALLSPSSVLLASASYDYDTASRLQTVSTLDIGLGTLDSATYSYLANSPLVGQIAFKQSGTTRMTTTKSYDNLNRLTQISTLDSGLRTLDSHTYNYNPANQRTKDTLADGSYWIYQYDSLGQVTGGNKYWSDGTPVAGQQFDYTFDNIGNRIQTQAGGDQNGGYLRTANYTNNTLNQITSRDVPGYVDIKGVSFATNTVTVNGQTAYRKVEYFRKELGVDNSSLALWTNIIVAATGQTSVTGNVLLAKSPQAFVYDADGNLTSDGLWTNTWDAENRLIATQNLTNVPSAGRMKEEWSYLPDGRWNQRIVSSWNGSSYVPQYTNRFVWDGKVLLAILDQTNGLVMSFMRGLDLSGSMQGAGGVGGLLAVSFKTNGTHFAAFDGNGNVSALVNAADGTTSANYEYDPFGQTIRITGAVGKLNPIRFSTQFADDVTQRIKYLHREYTPSTGTWSNHDPINEIGFQTLNRSRRSFDRNQEKNLYCFIANDPIKNIDLYALACGFFVVSPKQVPIYGSDADKRGVTPGTPVDGFSVRFVPDKNCCTCAKNNIHLVQTISFKHNYVPWWSDPTFDEQTGSGNLEITDAPWSGWLFGTAFKLKDCAYCSDGKALGCVSFTWAYDSFNSNPTLNPSGPSQAQDP